MTRSWSKQEDAQMEGSRKTDCPKKIKKSLTVSTEGLILSWMIDAMEGMDVATAYIKGAFLQTDY